MSIQEKVAKAAAIALAVIFFASACMTAKSKRASECDIQETDDGIVHHVDQDGQVTRYYRPKQCPKCGGDPRE